MKKKLLLTTILGSVLIFQIGSSATRGGLESLAQGVLDPVPVEFRVLTHSQRTMIPHHLEKVLPIINDRHHNDDVFYNPRLFCSLTNKGGYLPTKNNGVQIGGKDSYGFSTIEGCKEVLDSAKNNLICIWNGHTTWAYRISNALPVVNDNDFEAGFSNTRDCNMAIKGSSQDKDTVCLWNGRTNGGYLPYRISDGQALTRSKNISEGGRGQFGFYSQESCDRSIQRSGGHNICTWSGNTGMGYQLVHIQSASVIANFGSSSAGWRKCLERSSF